MTFRMIIKEEFSVVIKNERAYEWNIALGWTLPPSLKWAEVRNP